MESFLKTLSFEPDEFQRDALKVIDRGHSVVVCSPTGSGKTLIAEFAAHKAVEEGRKILYTTPLKALSNQKLMDFRKLYGEEQVGLLTGDITLNRDARILVMTTEVFRNMLYGIQEDSRLLNQVSCVVLDECHFMNDAERGTVWEESIIYCPDSIQIIALSATIANPFELTDWINEVHHNTEVVVSDFRPVPLRFSYFNREHLVPLFKQDTKQLNPQLKNQGRNRFMAKKLRAFQPNRLITELHQRDMLPAIFFTFSRKGCDKHLFETHGLDLLTKEERARLKTEIDLFVKKHPFMQGSRHLLPIAHGFASHHAGLLPAIKSLVEHLFLQGLIKVVFATETLAAGINMPARTTVITSISKRTNDGHRLLTASEFLQMSGRAGRRGMDEVGYVVTVASPYESAWDIAHLAASSAEPLVSQFTPTYGMVLNLLQKHRLSEVEFLISKSFGAFSTELKIQPLKDAIAEMDVEIERSKAFACPYDLTTSDFKEYLKSREKLHESTKLIKILNKQIKTHGADIELDKTLRETEANRDELRRVTDSSPCKPCDIYKKHEAALERIHRLEKKRKKLVRQMSDESGQYWQRFLNHYHLLKDVGFIDDQDLPTEPGRLTAQIRAENEFYVAQTYLSGLLDFLDPAPLAGVLCAIVNDSTRENLYSRCQSSGMVMETVNSIRGLIKRIYRLQHKHHIETPINLNPIASGLVEAWVQGMEWGTLVHQTNIDEGDLVRIIRRTADLLRQLSRVDGINTKLANTATIALQALYRDPIREESQIEDEEMLEEIDTQVVKAENH